MARMTSCNTRGHTVRLRNQIRIVKVIWLVWICYLVSLMGCEDTYVMGYNSNLETLDTDSLYVQ